MIERQKIHGSPLLCITLSDGSYVELYARGATLARWRTARGIDIVAGYEDYRLYGKGGMYLGTTVGLTAGRIKDGRCVIDGVEYRMASRAKHYLHNGGKGLDGIRFTVAEVVEDDHGVHVRFHTRFRHPVIPATTEVDVFYDVVPGDILTRFVVKTDASVPVNLTNHSYFNLSGDYDHPVIDHTLRVGADRIVLVDDEIIATDVIPVAGTMYDFRTAKPLIPVVLDPVLQYQGARGLDHYFLFDKTSTPQVTLASTRTGLSLDVATDYPGTTVYTTNYPNTDVVQTGKLLARHAAVAIEPQFQSNGINDPRFTDFILRPETEYRHQIRFTLRGDAK